MNKYRIVTKEHKELIETTCDKCGNIILQSSHSVYDPSWFSMQKGQSFGEDGGDGKYYKLDLCELCTNNLIQLLRDNQYNVLEEDWDY
jgi:hypothetical protein